MKKLQYILICLILTTQSSIGQSTTKKEIFNKTFNWTITIPENFENVSKEQWGEIQNKGADAIEKTYGEEVVNQSKTIFVFKSDQMNYFESSYQPFDKAIDGDYLEACKNLNEILYETFKTQMPDIKIEKSSSTEKIDNLVFQVFKMKVQYPNKMVLNVLMYSRLFGKKEFSVNIMYVDNLKGEQMLDSWKNSKFKKQ